MLIGIPREIKSYENRVGMTPASVREAVGAGHDVLVERNAGHTIGFDDAHYEAAGAKIAASAVDVFAAADMIVKVKEPQAVEIGMLREGQILFTYLHLAPDDAQTQGLLDSGCTAIAYETVTDSRGGLPLLAPMSEVAGRMAVQAGATCPGNRSWRTRSTARRRPRRDAGQGRRDRRRRRGRQFNLRRHRHGRTRYRHRPRYPPPRRNRRPVQKPDHHAVFETGPISRKRC